MSQDHGPAGLDVPANAGSWLRASSPRRATRRALAARGPLRRQEHGSVSWRGRSWLPATSRCAGIFRVRFLDRRPGQASTSPGVRSSSLAPPEVLTPEDDKSEPCELRWWRAAQRAAVLDDASPLGCGGLREIMQGLMGYGYVERYVRGSWLL